MHDHSLALAVNQWARQKCPQWVSISRYHLRDHHLVRKTFDHAARTFGQGLIPLSCLSGFAAFAGKDMSHECPGRVRRAGACQNQRHAIPIDHPCEGMGGAWKPRNGTAGHFCGRVAGAHVQGFGPKASAPVGFLQVSNIRLQPELRSYGAKSMGEYDADPEQPQRPSLADFDKRISLEPVWWQRGTGRAAALFWIIFATGIVAERVTATDATPYWRTIVAWVWPLPFALIADRFFRKPLNWQEKRDRRHREEVDDAWRSKSVKDRISYSLIWTAFFLILVIYVVIAAVISAFAIERLNLSIFGEIVLGLLFTFVIPTGAYAIWESRWSR